MNEIGLEHRLKTLSNGLAVVKFFESLFQEEAQNIEDSKVRQPVSILLLDINMPVLNGYETLIQVKSLFDKMNEMNPSILFMRPMICYLSQMADQQTMYQFLKEEEMPEIYLEKPLLTKDLSSLIRLADMN